MHTFALALRHKADIKNGALVQLVRIHACHAWGHGFESRTHRKEETARFLLLFIDIVQLSAHLQKLGFTCKSSIYRRRDF